MTAQTFDPIMALARYRELEALMNLELLNRPDWQERRENGDTTFLRQSKHFIAQNELSQVIMANGYDIVNHADDDCTDAPIYEIEKSEEIII